MTFVIQARNKQSDKILNPKVRLTLHEAQKVAAEMLAKWPSKTYRIEIHQMVLIDADYKVKKDD